MNDDPVWENDGTTVDGVGVYVFQDHARGGWYFCVYDAARFHGTSSAELDKATARRLAVELARVLATVPRT